MPELFAKISSYSQRFCTEMAFKSEISPHFRSSLVCGTNLPHSEEYILLQRTQLLHWIVVSGGHLIFWLQILDILSRKHLPHFFRWSFCLLYVFITGFQAPCVRSFFQLYLGQHNWFIRNSSPIKIFSAAILLSLCVSPHWIHSYSFYMSGLASLALICKNGLLDRLKNDLSLTDTLLVLLFMSPLITGFSLNSIFIQIAMTPLALLLLPLSVLSFFGTASAWLFEKYLQLFFHILKLWPLPDTEFHSRAWTTLWVWFLFLTLITSVVYSFHKTHETQTV